MFTALFSAVLLTRAGNECQVINASVKFATCVCVQCQRSICCTNETITFSILNTHIFYILFYCLLFLSTESTAVAATFLNTIQHPTLTGLWTIVQLSAQRLKGAGRMSLKVSYIDDYNPKRIMVVPSTL